MSERWISTFLDAQAAEANAARALVVDRHSATPEQLDSLPSPVGGFQIQQAPIVILWYVEGTAMDYAADRLIELVDVGGTSEGLEPGEALADHTTQGYDADLAGLVGLGLLPSADVCGDLTNKLLVKHHSLTWL